METKPVSNRMFSLKSIDKMLLYPRLRQKIELSLNDSTNQRLLINSPSHGNAYTSSRYHMDMIIPPDLGIYTNRRLLTDDEGSNATVWFLNTMLFIFRPGYSDH